MVNINIVKEYVTKTSQEIQKHTDNAEINKVIEDLITNVTGAERASVWVYDSKSVLLRQRVDGTPQEISMEAKKGLLYECFATKSAIISNYLASEKSYEPEIDNPDGIKIKSKIMLPIVEGNNFLGIATAYSSVKDIKNFDNGDLEVFRAILPCILNAIYKMNINVKNLLKDNNAAPRRRKTDSIQNLTNIEDSRIHTQTPQELLDYVANVVHDIRTPSNGLFGFLEILEEQVDDSRLKQYISHAKESASLINQLTTSILDGVSTKRELSQSKPETVCSFKFFADIAEIFSSNMYKKQICYNIFIDPSLPREIEVESIKLKRVIMNLIGNANKFTAKGKSIEFSVRYKQKDKKVHIFVKDSGIGIAKEKQEQIFEAFKQAEDNTSLEYGGTGLGLAISAGYVKDMGGKLLIDSELDKGSTFYFDIPIVVKNEENKFVPIKNSDTKISLLMKDKNLFVANHISRYLVKMGVDVDKIEMISDIKEISEKTTHIISFESFLSGELFSYIKSNKLKMMVVEENFLSLNKDNLDGALLISQYGYYADTLYSFINLKRKPKVLIVDDDRVSVTLIKTMLSDELCEIDAAYNGSDGLELLLDGVYKNNPYDIIYLDTNMPIMDGKEMLSRYRDEEKQTAFKPIKAVCISGDMYDENSELKEFDIYVGKPFDKQLIKKAFLDAIKEEL
jgi:signal transduction histidine kinase/CheY-like chemotaxis protein